MIRNLRRKALSFSFIILFSLLGCAEGFCCNSVVLDGSANVQSQMKKENVTYIVRYSFDLKGSEIVVPRSCQLKFQGGSFSNGKVKGNTTEISAKKDMIFMNVTLAGSWSNKIVYSEWLDFVEGEKLDNARNFQNLMLLCSCEKMTDLYMQKGVFYCSVISGGSNIRVPSNVYWHNSATICQLKTDSPKYGFVLLQKCDNVTIDGGEFVGDVQNHTGTDGEWGHGIKVGGSKNVVLKNLTAREFWGDGIDLIEGEYVSAISAGVGPCFNVKIENVKCLYNRRQGLSIEAAKNVTVKNSEFAYTGKYKITEPGCGIDIEPWCRNEEKITNIRFENCDIHDNNIVRDLSVEPNCQYNGRVKNIEDTPINKVVIEDCWIGNLSIHGANTVRFNNCAIEDISRYDNGVNITMTKCSVHNRTGVESSKGLTMKECKNESIIHNSSF